MTHKFIYDLIERLVAIHRLPGVYQYEPAPNATSIDDKSG